MEAWRWMKPLVEIYSRYNECRKALNETNDCTVTSLAFLMGWPYRDAHKAMERGGRQHRKGRYMHTAAASADMKMVNGLCPDKGVTLGEFCKAHPVGRYWVEVTKHALAVVDGQVHDHSLRPLRRVKRAWRIHNEPQLRIEHHGH
jgi:hypothetical protein